MWFEKSSKKMIFSISGWRGKFTDITTTNKLSVDDISIIYYGISAYVKAKQKNSPQKKPLTITIGRDSRYSGTVLLFLAKINLESLGCKVINLGIIPIPAIMAFTKTHSDGFIYFTASHNPPEYNGIKFGSSSGRNQTLTEYTTMMKIVQYYSKKYPYYSKTIISIKKNIDDNIRDIYAIVENSFDLQSYNLACVEYKNIVIKSVFKNIYNPYREFNKKLKKYITHADKNKLGILWDSNGGARSWTFDSEILSDFGISSFMINNSPGRFAHDIIPEGNSLNEAKFFLTKINKEHTMTHWLCAVVCDCDGDRGNTIFSTYSNNTNDSFELSAQEVFAMALKIELAWNNYFNPTNTPVAVAVNGPSSLRCNVIAKEYGALVFRSEVGESNVVSLGETLIEKGFTTPLVGEASNGGTIIFPSTVRDPLCNILSMLKGFLWAKKLKLDTDFKKNIASLPKAHTTASEDPLAKFKLPNIRYTEITKKILTQFSKHTQQFFSIFQSYNIKLQDYTFVNFSGTTMNIILKKNINHHINSGGLAIYFYTSKYTTNTPIDPIAFVWIRPSGTEPVVRLIADVLHENGEKIERELITTWRKYLETILF